MNYHAGLDLSGNVGCFALADADGNILIDAARPMRGATAEFIPWITGLLAEQSIELDAINRITIGSGPGSFSGLRIVSALVQGLSFHRSIATRSIPSAIGLARRLEVGDGGRIAVLQDGRNREIIVFPAKKQQSEVIPAATPVILNQEQAVLYFANEAFDAMTALGSDKSALEKIIPPPLHGAIQYFERPSAVEFTRARHQDFDGVLTELTYVRPAVYA